MYLPITVGIKISSHSVIEFVRLLQQVPPKQLALSEIQAMITILREIEESVEEDLLALKGKEREC